MNKNPWMWFGLWLLVATYFTWRSVTHLKAKRWVWSVPCIFTVLVALFEAGIAVKLALQNQP